MKRNISALILIVFTAITVWGVSQLPELQVDNINLNSNTISTTDTNGNLSLSPDGTGNVIVSTLSTGNRALTSGASGELTESSVTDTELGYLSGATSNIQTQIDAKLGTGTASTDNAITRFDGTSGQIQNSGVLIDDSNNIDAPGALALGSSITLDEIATPTAPAANELQVFAGDTNGITQLYMQDPTGYISIVNNDLYEIVRNNSGATIPMGSAVYISGSTGTTPTIDLAQADSNTTLPAVGIVAEDIANNSRGRVKTKGTIEGIDLSAFTNGDKLYVSESVAGGLTSTRPSLPNLQQAIGVVTNNGVGNGVLFVDVLEEDGNETGTISNSYSIGDATAGNKDLVFKSTGDGNLRWNPTAARTVTIPDLTGTLALNDSQAFTTYVDMVNQGEVRFSEQTGNGTNYVGFEAPDAVTTDTIWKLPDGDGLSTQALITDGAGNLSWGDAGGGGSSGINYSSNPDFETGVTDVTVTSNITRAEETATPIRDSKSLKLTIGTSATTADYADIPLDTFAKADTDTSKNIIISFEYYNDSNFSTDDVQFVLRNNTDSSDIIPLGDLNGKIQYSENTTKYVGYVQTKASVTDYSLRMNVLSAPSTASNIVIDTVKVGPDSFTAGAIVKKSQTYTPTWTGSSTNPSIGNGTLEGSYAQVGNLLYVEINLSVGSTTTTGSGFWEFSLPSGYVVDSTAVSALRGFTQYNDADTSGNRQIGAVFANTSNNYLRPVESDDTATGATSPFTWATNDSLRLQAWVPIEGEASTLISSTDALMRSAGIRYENATATSVPSATYTVIDYTTKDYDDINAVTTGASWNFVAQKTGKHDISAGLILDSATWSVNQSLFLVVYVNGSFKVQLASDYAQAGFTGFRSINGSQEVKLTKGDVVDIRVRHTNPSSVNILSSTTNYVTITPDLDLTSAGVYKNLKYLTSTSTIKTGAGSSGVFTYQQMTNNSITLPVGTWRLFATLHFYQSGTAGYEQRAAYWTLNNGADNTTDPTFINDSNISLLGGFPVFRDSNSTTADNFQITVSMPEIIVRVSEETEVFLVPAITATTPANARIRVEAMTAINID